MYIQNNMGKCLEIASMIFYKINIRKSYESYISYISYVPFCYYTLCNGIDMTISFKCKNLGKDSN